MNLIGFGFCSEGEHTMSTASMSFGRPTRVIFPSRGVWLAHVTAAAIGLLRRIDRWQRSVARDANTPAQVLAWADRIENSDPGFASDLRAAAQRALPRDEG